MFLLLSVLYLILITFVCLPEYAVVDRESGLLDGCVLSCVFCIKTVSDID